MSWNQQKIVFGDFQDNPSDTDRLKLRKEAKQTGPCWPPFICLMDLIKIGTWSPLIILLKVLLGCLRSSPILLFFVAQSKILIIAVFGFHSPFFGFPYVQFFVQPLVFALRCIDRSLSQQLSVCTAGWRINHQFSNTITLRIIDCSQSIFGFPK